MLRTSLGLSRIGLLLAFGLACWSSSERTIHAQGGGLLGQQQAVGGVMVDPSGTLTNAKLDDRDRLARLRRQSLAAIDANLEAPAELRKVSLRQLERALEQELSTGKPIPDAMRHLAGLQTIRYVFVYPEEQDIVLAGFGEGWQVDPAGNLIGKTTGRPVMLLDDLLIALRAMNDGPTVFSCSIDPTPEGLQKLNNYSRSLTSIGQPKQTLANIERLMGPQTIRVHGVPATSHFARVLVAADYRMKRIAMQFDPSPIPGLPSYLSMVQVSGKPSSMLPRWWLAMDYRPLVRDEAGLAWELPGASVKAMTEDDKLRPDGTIEHTGQAGALAQQWADSLTRKYDELARRDPIFAELKNVMDVSVVAALVVRQRLPEQAGLQLPLLLNRERLPNDAYAAPTQTPTIASAVQKVGGWVISASGGVEMLPWQAAEKHAIDAVVAQERQRARASTPHWWWN